MKYLQEDGGDGWQREADFLGVLFVLYGHVD